MKPKQAQAPLSKHFDSRDCGTDWHLYCRCCGQGWAVKKTGTHPGDLLHLLDHARGHKMHSRLAGEREEKNDSRKICGIEWVAPDHGATVERLIDAINRMEVRNFADISAKRRRNLIRRLADYSEMMITTLYLNGNGLIDHDIDRIEQWVADNAS